MTAGAPMAEVRDAYAGYGEIEVLHGLTLDVRGHALTTIIGANGAGKSTLLKLLFGSLTPRRGRVVVDGADVTAMPPAQRMRAGVSMVPQGRCNFPLMTVAENLELGGYGLAIDRRTRASEIERLMARFPLLAERRRILAGNLSGGEQQILEMAMVLVGRPKLLLLDEPSLGLSPRMNAVVFEEIGRLVADGITVLMIEQNAEQALRCSDHGIVLELGRISLAGSAREVLEDPDIRRRLLGI